MGLTRLIIKNGKFVMCDEGKIVRAQHIETREIPFRTFSDAAGGDCTFRSSVVVNAPPNANAYYEIGPETQLLGYRGDDWKYYQTIVQYYKISKKK